MANRAATFCPICKSEAKPLDRTGDAEGFDCPTHKRFKVAGSVFATRRDTTREEWEAALKRATLRANPDSWPVIQTTDF